VEENQEFPVKITDTYFALNVLKEDFKNNIILSEG
jgi:hypothetical protein